MVVQPEPSNDLPFERMPDVLTTQFLYGQLLEGERAAKFDSTEIRLSAVGNCPRQQTLRILGFVPDEFSSQQQSIFYTGGEHESTIYSLWAERFPRQVRRQIEVPTPYGRGHIDIWVAPLKLIVESKSVKATARDYLPNQAHIDQVLMYLHFWGLKHGATAEIAYRLKETGEIISVPVPYNQERVKHLLGVLDSICDAVARKEPLPVASAYVPSAFPCSWGRDDQRVFCGFYRYCWGGEVCEEKEGPFADVPAMAGELQTYAELEAKRAEAAARVKSLETAIAARREVLGKVMDLQKVHALVAGGIRVKRTIITPYTAYDVKQALEDKAVDPEILKPYLRTQGGGTRWTVKAEKAAKVKEVA